MATSGGTTIRWVAPGAAWSPHLEGSKDLEADWVNLKCGNYNKVTKKCGGQGS